MLRLADGLDAVSRAIGLGVRWLAVLLVLVQFAVVVLRYGFGSSLHLFNFLNASVDVGIPIIDQNNAGIFEEPRNVAGKPLITFRVWAEF